MYRIHLLTYKGLVITPDVVDALRALEDEAYRQGWHVHYVPHVDRPPNPLSLFPAGREVHFHLTREGYSPRECLYAAWGITVPLGFTPKLRDPIVGSGDDVYHFFGPWQGLYGKMLAEGRGHLAWPSVCCAAQVDVGIWGGNKEETRFVQAQLHRLGRNPGPLDGVVGPRTAAAMESLALARGSMTQVAEYLRGATTPEYSKVMTRGHLHLPNHELVVEGYGGVKAWPMSSGAGFEVHGPGRIVVDVR